MGGATRRVRVTFSLEPDTVREMERFSALGGQWSKKVNDMIKGFMKTAKENPTLIEAYGYRQV